MIDPFHVTGPDGITRPLNEHYDGMSDVEQDPYGAWLAIQNQSTRIEELKAENARLRNAVEQAATGWENLVELQLLPDRYSGAAKVLGMNARAALKGDT